MPFLLILLNLRSFHGKVFRMIAVFDACTLLNVIQVTLDEKYISFIRKVYGEFVIPLVVFTEMNQNKWKNDTDSDHRDTIDELINKDLFRNIDHQAPVKETKFMIKVLGQIEQNGEFMCIGHALNKSREGKTDLGENLHKVHVFTDDMPANSQFSEFYRSNLAGSILDSIDLMTIFCLKGFISFHDVIKYCNSLKLNYNRPASVLIRAFKDYKENTSKVKSSKQDVILSSIIDVLTDFHDDVVDKMQNLISKPEYKSLVGLPAFVQPMLGEFLKSNFRAKIPEINRRIYTLTKMVYEIK